MVKQPEFHYKNFEGPSICCLGTRPFVAAPLYCIIYCLYMWFNDPSNGAAAAAANARGLIFPLKSELNSWFLVVRR